MSMFSKKGIDTVDYSLLQKKGLIKKRAQKELPYRVNSQGMIDLTPRTKEAASSEMAQASSSEQSNSPFSFFDNIAQNASSQESTSSSGIVGSTSELGADNAEVNAIKIKMDDLEYKLTQLMDKLALIESKMDNFERKVVN